MSLLSRLHRVAPGLTARERAVLVLRSLKDGTTEDPAWRHSMPAEQAREFNRLIGLMNVANNQLSHLVTFICWQVEVLEMRLALFFALHLWEANLAEIGFAASLVTHETVTESEYRALTTKAEDEYVPVAEMAGTLADLERGWSDEDLEPVGWTQELLVKDDAWARLCGEAESRLRAAVKSGEIDGRGRGKGLKIRRSSFDAALGRTLTLAPEWAASYEIVPDGQAARAEADRRALALLRDAIARTPLDRLHDRRATETTGPGALMEPLLARLRQGIGLRWNDLRVAEVVLDEITADFGGEDPLKPATRESLAGARASLEKIVSDLAAYSVTVELTEPSDEELNELRDYVDRWAL